MDVTHPVDNGRYLNSPSSQVFGNEIQCLRGEGDVLDISRPFRLMIEMLDKAVAMDIYITCRRADINVRYLDVVTLALDMGGKSQCAVESVEGG
jgi:hypothetical protein